MRRIALILATLSSGAAQAAWYPIISGYSNVVTVSYGGSSVSYQESANTANGKLYQFTNDMSMIHRKFENTLNNVIATEVGKQSGASFRSGTISGNLHARMQPSAPNTLLMSLDGINYRAITNFSGKKFGVINVNCVNTFDANNISVTGQYGANDGVLQPSVGLNSNVNSSTDCDSNLSWILPVVGDLLVNKATGILDNRLEAGIREAMGEVKDKLLYLPDPAWGIGLRRLVPTPTGLTLPDGRQFDIGEYIGNNLPYLLGNSQIDIQFGRGLIVDVNPGNGTPRSGSQEANVMTISIASPAIAFTVKLSQTANVRWQWKCPPNSPRCIQP